MFRSNLTDIGLRPVKRRGVLVIAGNEIIDRLAQLFGRGEAGPAECAAHQDAEPALDLVEPTGVSGGEVKVHVRMAHQPAVVLGFVSTEVVQDDMDLPTGVKSDNVVYEVQKLDAPPPLHGRKGCAQQAPLETNFHLELT